MIGVLLGKLKLFIRTPGTFLTMTVLTLVFTLVVNLGDTNTVNVPVYTEDEGIPNSVVGELLEDSDSFDFQWMTKKEVEKEIKEGKAETGVVMKEDGFRLLIGVESGWSGLIRQTLEKSYMKKNQYEQVLTEVNNKGTDEIEHSDLQASMDSPVFAIETKDFHGEDATIYDQTFQMLFGITLSFVIYTIANNVFHILVEKEDGIWDRLILSPVKKWEMYAGNFVYSFLVGYVQILIVFLVFRYIAGVEFGGNFGMMLLALFPYVFAIVSLCILITGLVKTGQQYNVVTTVVALALAMMGGAFWPLEVVESEWILAISKINPVTYGLKLANGVVYGGSFSELMFPISILFLMSVVFTGIGIHLMERRHV